MDIWISLLIVRYIDTSIIVWNLGEPDFQEKEENVEKEALQPADITAAEEEEKCTESEAERVALFVAEVK